MKPFIAALLSLCVTAAARAAGDCAGAAGCYFSFDPPGASGRLNYYASAAPGAGAAPSAALIALHGHRRDANRTFDAARLAVERGGRATDTLVVAPIFQVATGAAARCRTAGVPAAQDGDLLWTCASWLAGGAAGSGNHPGSIAVLGALVGELAQRWPSLRVITIAGFSAGGQMVQHAIGFIAPPEGLRLRYVVSDPGTWLYFDRVRPHAASDPAFILAPPDGACAAANRWKYGTDGLPAILGSDAAQARARYAAADVSYIEAELDSGPARGAAYKVLDTSCAADAQGPFRLQRGLGYAFYDRTLLAPDQRRQVVIVPGCAHDVACVFPSPAARAALLGDPPVTRP